MKKRIKLFPVLFLITALISGCSEEKNSFPQNPQELEGLEFCERVKLSYAEQFEIDRYSDGYSILQISDGSSFLIVPENGEIPENLDSNIKIIKQPVGNIYLAATSVMGLFDAVGEGDAVTLSGTKAENWYIDYARNAMESGKMLYAGNYRNPDYELILSRNCGFAIQSTMINHTPEVKEKLEELGITVLVDYSSYETHPLGRSEWIKLYAEIINKEELAEELFSEQENYLKQSLSCEKTDKTVAFFYISSSGQAVTRKSGDYITQMIELAGGKNVFESLDSSDNALSTVTMEMEKFYSEAKNADVIIYNSTIDGEISSIEELVSKNELLRDFKAVKEGNVWCTEKNLYQESMKLGTVISDMNAIFTENTEENPPEFLYRVGD